MTLNYLKLLRTRRYIILIGQICDYHVCRFSNQNALVPTRSCKSFTVEEFRQEQLRLVVEFEMKSVAQNQKCFFQSSLLFQQRVTFTPETLNPKFVMSSDWLVSKKPRLALFQVQC